MTNTFLYSSESHETFSEQQIARISAAITNAVEEVLSKQNVFCGSKDGKAEQEKASSLDNVLK